MRLIPKKKYHGILKLACIFIVGCAAAFRFDFVSAFFWIVFVTFALFKIDAKYTGQGAIALLIVVPILQALERQAQAEQVAVYAYFLLVITVAVQLLELVRERNKVPPDTTRPLSKDFDFETHTEPPALSHFVDLSNGRLNRSRYGGALKKIGRIGSDLVKPTTKEKIKVDA